LLQRRKQLAGDGTNLADFVEVAFVLVAGRLQSEPKVAYVGLTCLVLLSVWAQSWVLLYVTANLNRQCPLLTQSGYRASEFAVTHNTLQMYWLFLPIWAVG
jgi:hypothetical protein